MGKKNIKKCTTSLVIKELKTKTTQRFYFTPDRMAKVYSSNDSSCHWDVDQEQQFSITGYNAKLYNHYGN